MLGKARSNIDLAFQAVLEVKPELLDKAEEAETYIDYLNKEISQYISKVISHETNETDSAAVSAYFKITGNIERIGDHAINICEYSTMMNQKGIKFSEGAKDELRKMRDVCLKALDILAADADVTQDWLGSMEKLEQRIDDMTAEFRQSQLERMKSGSCSDEACILFSELLTDFERIGDHALNIAQERAEAAHAR